MMQQKLDKLKQYLRKSDKLAFAFSGGVDSAFLLKVAHEVMGENVLAITARAVNFPGWELKEAEEFCKREKIRQVFFDFSPLEIAAFAQNDPKRCYYCKYALYERMLEVAKEHGYDSIADGTNLDDLSDYRPGLLAICEHGIISPLKENELRKEEIRLLSKEYGLDTWKKPSFACLASRFVSGEIITADKLQMVEKAETFLMGEGFSQIRVRVHGEMARIEVNREEMERFFDGNFRQKACETLKELGFSHVSLDLSGYRSGSMNQG